MAGMAHRQPHPHSRERHATTQQTPGCFVPRCPSSGHEITARPPTRGQLCWDMGSVSTSANLRVDPRGGAMQRSPLSPAPTAWQASKLSIALARERPRVVALQGRGGTIPRRNRPSQISCLSRCRGRQEDSWCELTTGREQTQPASYGRNCCRMSRDASCQDHRGSGDR